MKKIDFAKYSESILTGIDKVGKLSKLYRILIFLGIFAVLVGPFIYFIYLPKVKKIEDLKNSPGIKTSTLQKWGNPICKKNFILLVEHLKLET